MIERVVIDGYRLFGSFTFEPIEGMNIIVGDNEAGKSTLLEAISLALTGRLHGRTAQEDLNPYWFNRARVDAFFSSLKTGTPLPPPEIFIELYFSNELDSLQKMRGVNNSRQEKVPGMRMHIAPAEDFEQEFRDYIQDPDRPEILPTEWYEVDWRDFSDARHYRRPKGLGVSLIDSRTVRSNSGIDYHTRQMLTDYIEPKERAEIAIAHRNARHQLSAETLGGVNSRIASDGNSLHDKPIGLHMDQSANASWETSVAPQIDDLPFSLSGQGEQAAVKIALAMSRSADTTAYALVEEPENHLSHTSLVGLLDRLERLAGNRQVFLTTHSSFVLNRLGLDKLTLLHRGTPADFKDLTPSTVSYFKRLSGYDTLRLVLARSVVLVEGPSDEMVFERAFRASRSGARPLERGVDVVSMAGLSLQRGLELCAALDRNVAVLRDNDGKEPSHWRVPLEGWLKPGSRELFIGDPADGPTLEPQFMRANDESLLRREMDIPDKSDSLEWMTSNKTEWALRIEESAAEFSYPKYILDAVEFSSSE